ncbi:MAG: bifunctional nuclease family protein [Dehalococcoidales bacterium]|nr:bifunctional nuclease family protein [Dehalococcoidales bacterium]
MLEMTIESIRVGLMNPKLTLHNSQYVVMLKEKEAERYLPIFIGPAEANAIAIKLRGEALPRPLTHDLLRNIVEMLGASVNSIRISDLMNDTFYAKIILNIEDGQMEIDARPSDALALAVRVEVPIYAEESVLEKAGISLDKVEEAERMTTEEKEVGEEGKGKKTSDEELKRLSAFSDFIDGLDLEDFDKNKS